MKKFSDFATAMVLDGPKVNIKDVVGKEIVVTGYTKRKSKYDDAKNPECLTCQFYFCDRDGNLLPGNAEHNVFFSGSTVLMNLLDFYRSEIPFQTTIAKQGKYYTFG